MLWSQIEEVVESVPALGSQVHAGFFPGCDVFSREVSEDMQLSASGKGKASSTSPLKSVGLGLGI